MLYHHNINETSLFPQGEGQDEGKQLKVVAIIYPLSPTLSRRERELIKTVES
jgi:hypothetical protein